MHKLVKSGKYCFLDALAVADLASNGNGSRLERAETGYTLHVVWPDVSGKIGVQINNGNMTLSGDSLKIIDRIASYLGGRRTSNDRDWVFHKGSGYTASRQRLLMLSRLSKQYPDAGGMEIANQLDVVSRGVLDEQGLDGVSLLDEQGLDGVSLTAEMLKTSDVEIKTVVIPTMTIEDMETRLKAVGYAENIKARRNGILFMEIDGVKAFVSVDRLDVSRSRDYVVEHPDEFSGLSFVSLLRPVTPSGAHRDSDASDRLHRANTLRQLGRLALQGDGRRLARIVDDRCREKAVANGFLNLQDLPKPDNKSNLTIWSSLVDDDLSLAVPVETLMSLTSLHGVELTPSEIVANALMSGICQDGVSVSLIRDVNGDAAQDIVAVRDVKNNTYVGIKCCDKTFCTPDSDVTPILNRLEGRETYTRDDVLSVLDAGYVTLCGTHRASSHDLARQITRCLKDMLEASSTVTIVDDLKARKECKAAHSDTGPRP